MVAHVDLISRSMRYSRPPARPHSGLLYDCSPANPFPPNRTGPALQESTGVGAEAGGGSELVAGGPGGRGKVAALVPGLDQSVYVAYRRGVLEKYTEWGRWANS